VTGMASASSDAADSRRIISPIGTVVLKAGAERREELRGSILPFGLVSLLFARAAKRTVFQAMPQPFPPRPALLFNFVIVLSPPGFKYLFSQLGIAYAHRETLCTTAYIVSRIQFSYLCKASVGTATSLGVRPHGQKLRKSSWILPRLQFLAHHHDGKRVVPRR
jgi:hypothetical protein